MLPYRVIFYLKWYIQTITFLANPCKMRRVSSTSFSESDRYSMKRWFVDGFWINVSLLPMT